MGLVVNISDILAHQLRPRKEQRSELIDGLVTTAMVGLLFVALCLLAVGFIYFTGVMTSWLSPILSEAVSNSWVSRS